MVEPEMSRGGRHRNVRICRVALVQHCARDRSKRPGSGVFDAARRPGAELEPVLVDRFTAHVALPVGAVGQLGLGAQHGLEGGVERLRRRSVGHLLDRLGRALADALAEPDRRAVGDWRRQPLDGAPQVGFLRVEFGPHPRQVEIRHPAIMPRSAQRIVPTTHATAELIKSSGHAHVSSLRSATRSRIWTREFAVTCERLDLPRRVDRVGTWIGTSGWSYEHWQDVLYHGCSPADRLSRYAAEFDTVELNASFYRWPRDAAFTSWQRRLPDGFRMSVKAPRALTHARKLYSPESWTGRIPAGWDLSLIHISEPTRQAEISYAVF